MKEKLIPGQVLYASKGIAWKKATIVGIDSTRTTMDDDVMIIVVQETWDPSFHADYLHYSINGIVSYIKDGFFSLAGPRLSKSFWRN